MKQQIKYAWKDILKYKSKNIILFIQIAAILILLSFIFSILMSANDFQTKLNQFIKEQKEEIYYYFDISDEERINRMLGTQESLDSLEELLFFITQNPTIKTYTGDQSYSIWLSKSPLDRSFAIDPRYGSNEYFLIKIDDGFQRVFNLKPTKGRVFSEDDFNDESNEIPLILGFDFQKYYKLNDKIYDDQGLCYKVIGFLEKEAYYLSPTRGGVIFWLDKAFIIPIQPKKFMDAIDYDSTINSTYIITDSSEDLQAIQKKSNELGLYTFSFRSFTEQLHILSEYKQGLLQYRSFIVIVIMIFAIISFISNLVQFINSHTKEFAIHLLCGGQIKNIIQRILIQTFFIIFCANIIIVAIHKFRIATLLTIGSSLFIGGIILIYPIILLSKKQVNTVLKRSE